MPTHHTITPAVPGETPSWGKKEFPLSSLMATLSSARLARYLSACAGDVRMAIECHYWNTQLGHALYFPLQTFEILLRNTINAALVKEFGPDWLVQHPAWLGDLPGKTNRQRQKIEGRISEIVSRGGVAHHNKLLSELHIGFWVSLLSSRYTQSLWVPYLRHCFPHHPSGSGEDVGKRAEKIRDLRNRVAHHEPIIFVEGHCHFLSEAEIRKQYDDIIEAVGWVCGETKNFVTFRCEFTEMVTGFSDFLQHATSADSAEGVNTRVPWMRPTEGRIHIVRARVKFYDPMREFGYLIPDSKHLRDLRIEKNVLSISGLESIYKNAPVEVTFTYSHSLPKVLKIHHLVAR